MGMTSRVPWEILTSIKQNESITKKVGGEAVYDVGGQIYIVSAWNLEQASDYPEA